jgi:hypothetical protein
MVMRRAGVSIFSAENDPVTETRTGALTDNRQKLGWTEGQPAGMKIDVECLLLALSRCEHAS